MKMLISKMSLLRGARAGAISSAVVGAGLLASCGGGGDPLSNPPSVSNPPTSGAAGSESLSFAYFERCIFPIFLEQLPITQNGVTSTNTCSGAGCHDSNTGTGGALRVIVAATAQDIPDSSDATAVATLRATDMYKNFYSAQGVTVFGSPLQSRLFEKPLVLNVLHGGGRIFASEDDPHVLLISYWISHPMPSGQGEFSTDSYSMFSPAIPTSNPDGTVHLPTAAELQQLTCNTQ